MAKAKEPENHRFVYGICGNCRDCGAKPASAIHFMPAPKPEPTDCPDCEGRGGQSVYCCSDEQCGQWETCETCGGTGEVAR